MPQCAVATCRNSHRRTRGRRIRYHRFPQIPEVRARWVRACGRAPLSNGDIPFNIQTARICSLHFTNDSYEKDMEHLVLGLPVRSRLRRGAVPTIGVPVNVQPVTKMLVEDAKRSILKVAHGKITGSSDKMVDDGDEHYYRNKHHNQSHQQRQERLNIQDVDDRGATNLENENNDDIYDYDNDERRHNFEPKITGIDVLLALGLKPACRLNKMHAMDCGTTSTTGDDKNVNEKKMGDEMNDALRIPQNRQNGAALPEETATATSAATGRIKIESLCSIGSGPTAAVKKENHSEAEEDITEVKKKPKTSSKEIIRKRRSNDNTFSANGNPKRICLDQRERYIDSLVGCERIGAEELATRADELRAEVQALDELARAKEMEWNEILSMRKLKEEAYLRVERKRQVMSFLESNSSMSDNLPPASLSVSPEWEESCREHNQDSRDNQESSNVLRMNNEEKFANQSQSETTQESSRRISDEDFTRVMMKRDDGMTNRHQKSQRNTSLATSSKLCNDNGRKQRRSIEQNVENRQIGEGRQGPTVDVRSIIADYRLRHPEMVPRRGRRMRNSVNIGLGAGGAMVDTSHGDSRPSSTDSCKSNNNANDVNSTMSFKDVLVQFAKLSQQQGEPVKTPQNYPDVTLHPVAPSPTIMNSSATPHQTGSLLHGILTKSQSPRPTTFSPTLARLLTAPERERNTPPSGSVGQHQPTQAQHLFQSYQGSNSVTISDLLSSSKARTEITITPVVNTPLPSTPSNNIVHVDDVEEENSLAEDRDIRRSTGTRDNREDRDTPPRCQGCHERAAQFVCAGCGNQWYCSRECQVSAWDEHSEVCSG